MVVVCVTRLVDEAAGAGAEGFAEGFAEGDGLECLDISR